MTRDEIQDVLDLIRETDHQTLYQTLDGASRQLTELETDYREGQQKLVRLANAANRAISHYRERKKRIVESDIPFYRQEMVLIGKRTSGANIRHLLAQKLIDLNKQTETLDKKMEHRLRQVRLEARAVLEYGSKVQTVETAYQLINQALSVYQMVLDLGIDPQSMTDDDVRRVEILLAKG